MASAARRALPAVGQNREKVFNLDTSVRRLVESLVMAQDRDCYLCGDAIDGDQATVVIPRLGLRVHLSCYERDTGAQPAAPPIEDERPRIRIVRAHDSA